MTPAEALDQALAAARAALPRWVPRRAFDAFVAANRDALIARVARSPRFRGPLALPPARDWAVMDVVEPVLPIRERRAANAPAPRAGAAFSGLPLVEGLPPIQAPAEEEARGMVRRNSELARRLMTAPFRVREVSLENHYRGEDVEPAAWVAWLARSGPPYKILDLGGGVYKLKHSPRLWNLVTLAPPPRVDMGNNETLSEGVFPDAQRPEGARWSGRADHEDRRERRVERLKAGAAKSAAEAEERRAAADRGLPDFNQPILVGHHSERRHRRAIERSHENMRRSIDAADRSRNLASRADAAEKNRAISSDDPNAPERLREKIAELEAEVARSKAINKAVRAKDPHAALAAMGFNEKAIARLLTPDFAGRKGVPGFYFTNTGANIRRLKARLQQFEQAAETAAPAPVTIGSGTASWDTESNRVVVELPRPTSDEEKKRRHEIMRSSGFVWSPSRSAYVRQANNRAWWSAKSALEAIERVP